VAEQAKGGISRKIKNFWFVYGYLNATHLAISIHQRCSVTFKMHQIHFRLGFAPDLRSGAPGTL